MHSLTDVRERTFGLRFTVGGEITAGEFQSLQVGEFDGGGDAGHVGVLIQCEDVPLSGHQRFDGECDFAAGLGIGR